MGASLPGLSADRPFFGRIESIRGLGTLAVAGYHCSGWGFHGVAVLEPSLWTDASPLQIAVGRFAGALFPGHAFLMAFFVVSGLVLRVSLEHGPKAIGAASGKFLVARLFRFYPIVWAGVLLAALHAPNVTGERLIANLLLFDVSMNTHLWALQVELLMIPVILALFFLERRTGPAPLLAIAFVASVLVFVPNWAVSSALSGSVFAFVLGMALPTFGRRFITGLSRRVATLGFTAAALVLFTAGTLFGMYNAYTTVIEGYSAAIVLGVVAYRVDIPLLSWLDARWLRILGGASGSYYVLHMVVLTYALRAAETVIDPSWVAQGRGVAGIAVTVGVLLAIAPLMVGVSKLVEMPGIALGRRLVRAFGWERRREPAAAQPVVQRLAA